MATINRRIAASVEGDFVVFIIGARFNRWWKAQVSGSCPPGSSVKDGLPEFIEQAELPGLRAFEVAAAAVAVDSAWRSRWFTGAKGVVCRAPSVDEHCDRVGVGDAELPLIALAQSREEKKEEAEKKKEEKKDQNKEKKDEAKDKAEDAVEDRDKVADPPGTDRSQDRRQDRRRDAVK